MSDHPAHPGGNANSAATLTLVPLKISVTQVTLVIASDLPFFLELFLGRSQRRPLR